MQKAPGKPGAFCIWADYQAFFPPGASGAHRNEALQHQFSHIIEIQCLDDAFTRQPILKSCCQHFDPRTV
ncbi:hypothetical protein CLOLEP_00721 [[Clostridium] leptum DSM 753]|uniref:Uncharacterized protein n=1 Tax=[Clostridium] leptum DSM 753 TaxID=428125 RepID=A7VQ94_9FIRM|nr:hypothetical protein CLOLEP_00721 [[Clostridium] leptum DSM 753]PEQ24204.1 hypothetical protein CH238_09980 [[Clostridium] leptum DSM 753]